MGKNKFIAIFIALAMMLVGCSKNYMGSVYNNNDKIASDSNSYNLNIEDQNVDGQNFIGIIKNIEGMDTIWTYEADKDMELDMTYLLKVSSGKFKLVLISPDKSVTNIIEMTRESDVTDYATSTLKIKKGLNRIKMVGGHNTSVEFNISITEGDFQELGM